MICFISSCSLKLQVVSEGGTWRKLQLTHSVRAHFGFQESYHTQGIYPPTNSGNLRYMLYQFHARTHIGSQEGLLHKVFLDL